MRMSAPRRLALAATGAAVITGLLLGGAAGASASPAATSPAAPAASASTAIPHSVLLTSAELPDVGSPWSSQEITYDTNQQLMASAETADGAYTAGSTVGKYRNEAEAAYYSDTARLLADAQSRIGQGGLDPVHYTKLTTVDGVDVFQVAYYTWGYYVGDAVVFATHDGLYTYQVKLWLPDPSTATPDVTATIAAVKRHLATL
ncbi:hypothetical protein [Goodfellowiella coeruleoviolacea]|uniref:Uncharacterized protein n=1 Tax=Goodfellowiella coeruleoviolacea TaxID=334858 RepID=A0AAE3GG34_9PSEU|nr:hypothetical protein [Goodfellowiella coeruleoviolacea]MCP2166752.1 hypothetical protein [Goodfellowiella coeruleoviolacea]